MALPLQPSLRPMPVRLRRVLLLVAAAGAVLLLGIAARPATAPPRLLTGGLDGASSYARTVDRLVRGARQRVWLMCFVLYPDGEDGVVQGLCHALADARRRGCDVRVVIDLGRDWETQEIEDKHVQAVDLLEALGVPVLLDELERTSHVKAVLVDDDHLVLGSHNWTRSALTRNRETSLHLQDRRLVAELEAVFRSVPGFDGLGR